jgi:hypothetical protein
LPRKSAATARHGRLDSRRDPMLRMLPVAVCAAVAVAVALPARAASPVSLRLGGDYLLDGGPGVFSVGLGLETLLGRRVSVGGRFGGLLTTSPTSGGVPLDVFLRLRFGRVYLEGVGGPWFFFTGDTLRGHGAVGFGLFARDLEFGAEIGFLSPDRTQLGLRLGLRI